MKNVGLLTCMIGVIWLFCVSVVAQDEPPQNPIITPDNVTQIQELRMLGRGNALETIFSPDGTILAVASSIGIWLYDFHDLEAEPRFLEGHTRDVISIDFSPDGQFIASGSYDETLRIWDVETGGIVRIIQMPKDIIQEYSFSPVYDLAYSPDGQFIVTGSGQISIWDAQTGDIVQQLAGHENSIKSIAYSPDGLYILSGAGGYLGEERVRLWNVQTGEILKSAEPDMFLSEVAYSPDGESIAYVGSGRVVIRDVNTWEVIQIFDSLTQTYDVISLDFSPDSQFIIAGGSRGNSEINVWNIQTGENTLILEGHKSNITSLFYSPNGQFIVSNEDWGDNSVRIWDAQTGELISSIAQHIMGYTLTYSPDNQFILASGKTVIWVWNINTGEIISTLKGHTVDSSLLSIVYSPDGGFIATASNSEIKMWDANTWEELDTILSSGKWQSIIYRPDGKLFVYSREGYYYDTSITLASVTEPYEEYFFGYAESLYRSVNFSPDGRFIMVSVDGNTGFWDVTTREIIFSISESFTFSPDGQYILTASEDGLIKKLDVETMETIWTLEEYTSDLECFGYTPNGQFIVSKGMYPDIDNALKIWDANTGKQLHQINDVIGCGSFSPDGRTLAFSVGGTIRIWGIPASPTP